MMMTWTYNKSGFIAVVTAENVKQAIYQLGEMNILNVTPVDLIPVVTRTRFTRILASGDIPTPSDVKCS